MSKGMSTTPRFTIPPPVDDPERRAQAASFEDTLDDTIDQSFPASDPPSTNPAPSYARDAGVPATSGEPRVHMRHEGLVWAAGGALGVIAALAIVRYVYGQREPRRVA